MRTSCSKVKETKEKPSTMNEFQIRSWCKKKKKKEKERDHGEILTWTRCYMKIINFPR